MSKVFKCDICGKVEPRSIRHLIMSNPDVSDKPLNKEKYYAFNIIPEDFCDECINKLEHRISGIVYEMKKEAKGENSNNDYSDM